MGTTWKTTELSKKEIPLRGHSISPASSSSHPHALGPTVNRAREASRLPREMEPDIEVEQVRKDVSRNAPDRVLRDVGEYGVPEFGEEPGSDSCESVWEEVGSASCSLR